MGHQYDSNPNESNNKILNVNFSPPTYVYSVPKMSLTTEIECKLNNSIHRDERCTKDNVIETGSNISTYVALNTDDSYLLGAQDVLYNQQKAAQFIGIESVDYYKIRNHPAFSKGSVFTSRADNQHQVNQVMCNGQKRSRSPDITWSNSNKAPRTEHGKGCIQLGSERENLVQQSEVLHSVRFENVEDVERKRHSRSKNRHEHVLSPRHRLISSLENAENRDPNTYVQGGESLLQLPRKAAKKKIPERLRALLPRPRTPFKAKIPSNSTEPKSILRVNTHTPDHERRAKKRGRLSTEALAAEKDSIESGASNTQTTKITNICDISKDKAGITIVDTNYFESCENNKILNEDGLTQPYIESESDRAAQGYHLAKSGFSDPINPDCFTEAIEHLREVGFKEAPDFSKEIRPQSPRQCVSLHHWREGLDPEQRVICKLLRFSLRAVRKGMFDIRDGENVVNSVDYVVGCYWAAYIQGKVSASQTVRFVQKYIQECCVIFETFSIVEAYITALQRSKAQGNTETEAVLEPGNGQHQMRSIADISLRLKLTARQHSLEIDNMEKILNLVCTASMLRARTIIEESVRCADRLNLMYRSPKRVQLLEDHVTGFQRLERSLCLEAKARREKNLSKPCEGAHQQKQTTSRTEPFHKAKLSKRDQETADSLTNLINRHSKYDRTSTKKKLLDPLLPLWLTEKSDGHFIPALKSTSSRRKEGAETTVEDASCAGQWLVREKEGQRLPTLTLENTVNFVIKEGKSQRFRQLWKWSEILSARQSTEKI